MFEIQEFWGKQYKQVRSTVHENIKGDNQTTTLWVRVDDPNYRIEELISSTKDGSNDTSYLCSYWNKLLHNAYYPARSVDNLLYTRTAYYSYNILHSMFVPAELIKNKEVPEESEDSVSATYALNNKELNFIDFLELTRFTQLWKGFTP